MPKLVTVLRPEKIQEQARIYVRSYILMPSGVVGLVCMIGGLGSLGYQLLSNHTYTSLTFLASSGLLVIGALCGCWERSGSRLRRRSEFALFASAQTGAPGARTVLAGATDHERSRITPF